MNMRIVSIKSIGIGDSDEYIFDPKKMTDSEALHYLLCMIYPSDEYTVSFKNVECKHLNVKEIGLIDCGFGCKLVKCDKCESEFDSHRRIYGCPQG